MEFMELLRKRKSIRAYKDTPIPAGALKILAEAVQLAPTACNKQPFKVLVITDPSKRDAVCSVYSAPWLKQAPAIAVVIGNPSECWTRLEGTSILDVDCAIVMEHLVLAAADEGLGSCWICAFERERLKQVLSLPSPWTPIALTPLGYPAEDPVRRARKNNDQIFEVL